MDTEHRHTLIRAAEYVRMSTDHQQYSTANQSDAIRAYAAERGMEIVRTYADEGKSGLSLYMRGGLRRLLQDVQSGEADFTVIIVFDVSRWGRFQDSDESAYHEYICKLAGISVHYCAEQFENDGSPISTIVKSIKRAMAGEYSRELSVKVFAGQRRIVEQGFRLGGLAGYGLRRTLIDQNGTIKCSLAKGEWKSITTDRVVLSLGPSEELEIVRSMYAMFVHNGKNEYHIAKELNDRELKNHLGNIWKAHNVLPA